MMRGSINWVGGYFASTSVSTLILVLLLWLGSSQAFAETQCYVQDPELQLSYRGDCLDGKAHGQGVAVGVQGAVYQGQFKQGAASGYGVKLYANGDTYAGEWLQGYRHGFGVYEYGERSPWRGDKYIGQWFRDLQHGRGTYLFFPTMETFESEWVKGHPQATASPLLQRRQRSAAALAAIIGQVGTQVCSILTDGAEPERVARGKVVAVHDDRIQVDVETAEVLANSNLRFNPRWDLITVWGLCADF